MYPKRLFYFPNYTGVPYQRLLYETFNQNLVTCTPGNIEEAIASVKSPGTTVFHIHWLNALFKNVKSQEDAWKICARTIYAIEDFIGRGGKLVWTIHNKLSHDSTFVEVERRLRHFLSCSAHIVHLHGLDQIEKIKDVVSLDIDRVVINEMGNFIGSYGFFDINSRLTSPVIKKAVFLGQLRPYKSLSNLVEVVNTLDRFGIETMIAGKPLNFTVADYIRTHVPSRTKLALKFIKDNEVHKILSEYNIGILSYRTILNSATLILYESYGLNILSTEPEWAGSCGIPDNSHHFFNNPDSIDSLLKIDDRTFFNRAKLNFARAKTRKWTRTLAHAIEAL